jgi:hypothetical protein
VSILLCRARRFACAWRKEAIRLSEIWRALSFRLEKEIFAAAVNVFVDSGVFDGFSANRAIDHVEDAWLDARDANYSGVANATSEAGAISEQSPLDDGRRRTGARNARRSNL